MKKTIKNLEKRCSYAWAKNYEKDELIDKRDKEISMLKKQLKLKNNDIYNMETHSFKERICKLNKLTEGFLQDEPIQDKIKITKIIKTEKKTSKPKLKVESKPISNIISTINTITGDSWLALSISKGKRYIDTFFTSVAMNIDEEFYAYHFRERQAYVKTLKQKMAVDLIEQNLYRLYQYHHIRSFKKSQLEDDLNEGRDSDVTKRYLSDYLDINILCIDKRTSKSLLYRDTYHKTLSIILLIDLDGKFKPLLSSSGNHFIHPKAFEQIISKFPIQNIKEETVVTKKVNKSKYKSVKLSEHFKDNKIELYSISRYTIAQLQKIAEDYDIPLHNIRELKSGEKRLKNKTKRELYDLIMEKAT